MDRDHVAIPALLALSAIHQHLVREGLRTTAGLVVETGSAREVHHFGVLAGYGAEAMHPYLAMETLADDAQDLVGDLSAEKAIYNYVKAIGKGLSKIMSKMGVSTYMSYCGAQMFEAIGLEKDLVDKVLQAAPRARSAASACSRSPKKRSACTSAAFGDDPVLERHGARRRRRIRLARARRRAHVDARRDRQAAAQRRAPTSTTPTRNTRRSSTTSRTAT